jgi:hypothetical protein
MKCATTSLIKNIAKHPEIYVPQNLDKINKKAAYEVQFFNKQFNKGTKWYDSFFKEGYINGEKTPNYIHKIETIRRIIDYNHLMKFIVNIRNPVNRYVSHCKMKMDRKNKGKINNDFIAKKFNNGQFLEAGLYYKKLTETLLKRVNRDQLYINVVNEIDHSHIQDTTNHKYGINLGYRINLENDKTENKMLDIFKFIGVSQDVNLSYQADYITNYNGFELSEQNKQALKSYYRDDIYKLSSLIEDDSIKKWVD